MDNKWLIILLLAVAAVVLYFVFRKQTVKTSATALSANTIDTAPGVNPANGQTLNYQAVQATSVAASTPGNENSAPAGGVTDSIVGGSAGVLQHVPIVGGAAATGLMVAHSASKAVVGSVNAGASKLNSAATAALKHVPVVGKPLASVNKAVGNVAKKLTSWL